MYQAWQWPAQSTDTTYAQPATAVAQTATAAATPAAVAAAAAAANTWPYGQYAVANMQQQWAWAAQNQYAYAASLAAGQQGAVAAAYPGVWPGQAAATATAAATAGTDASSTPSATTAKSSGEKSKEELTPKDTSEMEKLNQLRAQAQQWTSQQQTAAWGMPTGAASPATPATSTAAATTAASWGQNSWNQSNWNAGQWAAAANQWQQASGAAGPTTTAPATMSGSQAASEMSASGMQLNSQQNDSNKMADAKQVDMSELDKEEEEFDKQFTEWEKQFESWKDQNKDHPDKEAFAQYEKQWKAWREQLLQKKEEMKKKRADKLASAGSAPAPASASGTTAKSDIPGLDFQDDKSSSVTTVAPTNAMTSASGMPQVQGAIPTAAIAPSMAGAMDPSMMYQNQMRMPGAQPFMYMPPQPYMYPPMPGAPGMPPPMMPQQAMPYGAQQPPAAMMGQGDGMQNMMGQQPPLPPTSGDAPPPAKRALLATPPPPGGPGGRFDRPEMMNEGPDMMPPGGGRMEPPYGPGPRDPHMMRGGMDEEPYDEEWGYGGQGGGGGRGMDFFRGRGRGGPMRGRGRGRGGRWGGDGDFDGGPGGPPDRDMGPPGRQFDPDFPPDRFRAPELDTDAFDPEFSVLESSKFPPEPPEGASNMPPFEDGDFGPRGRPPGPFPDRRFGPDGPFNDQGPPFHDRPFPRDSQFDDQMYPSDFDERYPPPDGFDNSKGGPGEFDGPEDFDESGPPGGKRFPPMRDEGRFMNNRFGPRGPPFGPRHPFEGDFAPRGPFDDRFRQFPDEGFRGDRFRMRGGGRFPPPRGDFGPPERFPPPGGDFGPRNFSPGDRFRCPPDEDFRGPNRGPMRGGRFQIDYDNRPASAVMGEEFKKYDAFDSQFGSDIINFRDSCYMGYERENMEALIFSEVDVELLNYDHGKSPIMKTVIPGRKNIIKEDRGKPPIRDPSYGLGPHRDRSPLRDRNFRDMDERMDRDRRRERNREGDRDERMKDLDQNKDRFRDRDDRKLRELDRERDRNRDRDIPNRDRDIPNRERDIPNRERDIPNRERDVPNRERDVSNRERDIPNRERDVPNRERDVSNRERDVSNRERDIPNRERDIPNRERDIPNRERDIPNRERDGRLNREKEGGSGRERDGPRRSRWEPKEIDVPLRERSPEKRNQNGDRPKDNPVVASSENTYPVPKDIYNSDTTGEGVQIKDLLYIPGRLNRPKQLVIIVRGLPGAGKTHVARLIKDKEIEQGGCAPRILSLDDYFMVETEVDAIDEESGRKIKKKEFQYEYEAAMEEAYRSSLLRSFKKTIDDRFFPFIIVDAIHNEVKQFEPLWSYAKQRGFQVYIAEMDCFDPVICHKRNIHKRALDDITKLQNKWEKKPRHFLGVDIRSLLQDVSIPEVEMEDSSVGVKAEDDEIESSDTFMFHVPSKWEKLEATEEKLDQLDGLRIKKKHTTMEDYLQCPDDYEERESAPGKKRVRWADLEERKEQDRLRAIGFVVGQTDWQKMTDPTHADRALTRTKYI